MSRAQVALGARGEDAVAAWYRSGGFEIVERNWRDRRVPPDRSGASRPGATGELDLIARRGRLVCVCEVKTRSSDRFGSPAESVTAAKQRRIRRLAAAWLASGARAGATPGPRPAALEVRFDVAEVGRGGDGRLRVTVIESAF